MKRWNVYAAVHASAYLGEYEAETEDDAIEMALNEASVSVCHYCAKKIQDPEIGEATAEEIKS